MDCAHRSAEPELAAYISDMCDEADRRRYYSLRKKAVGEGVTVVLVICLGYL